VVTLQAIVLAGQPEGEGRGIRHNGDYDVASGLSGGATVHARVPGCAGDRPQLQRRSGDDFTAGVAMTTAAVRALPGQSIQPFQNDRPDDRLCLGQPHRVLWWLAARSNYVARGFASRFEEIRGIFEPFDACF